MASNTEGNGPTGPPPEIIQIANVLKGQLKTKYGAYEGRRIAFFKGKYSMAQQKSFTIFL